MEDTWLVLRRKLAKAGNGPLSTSAALKKKDSRHCAQQLSPRSRHMQVLSRQGLCQWQWTMLPCPRAFSGLQSRNICEIVGWGSARYKGDRTETLLGLAASLRSFDVSSQPPIVWRRFMASFASYVHKFFVSRPLDIYFPFYVPQPDDWLWACPTNRRIEDGVLRSIFGSFDGSLDRAYFG